jgi:hypothetical protein
VSCQELSQNCDSRRSEFRDLAVESDNKKGIRLCREDLGWLHTQRHRSYEVRTIHVASSSRI